MYEDFLSTNRIANTEKYFTSPLRGGRNAVLLRCYAASEDIGTDPPKLQRRRERISGGGYAGKIPPTRIAFASRATRNSALRPPRKGEAKDNTELNTP